MVRAAENVPLTPRGCLVAFRSQAVALAWLLIVDVESRTLRTAYDQSSSTLPAIFSTSASNRVIRYLAT